MPQKPSACLGISYGRASSSAALIVDGCLVAAAEEGRFSRFAYDPSFPTQAIQFCLKQANISGRDISVVAFGELPKRHWFKRLKLMLAHPRLGGSFGAPPRASIRLSAELRKLGLHRARRYRIEHTVAHMMSARYLSTEDTPALLSIDGLGDIVSVAMGRPTGAGVEILDRVFFPHSLGAFFTALAHYLGFLRLSEQCKLLELSASGKDTYARAMHTLIQEKGAFGFELNLEAFPILRKPVQFSFDKKGFHMDPFYSVPFLTQIIGLPPRKSTDPITQAHRNLACSVQARFEELGNRLLGYLHEKVPSPSVALAGGCAHNFAWVGKIPRRTPFQKVFVAPASHDAGIAVGAAVAAAGAEVLPEAAHWALLGPSIIEDDWEAQTNGLAHQKFRSHAQLIEWLVAQIVDEKIVGMARERMEWGPNALGNRSLLADPRKIGVRNRLWERFKHLGYPRPFRASVLAEHQNLWFKHSFECPSMEASFEAEELIRDRIPAVLNADNTCRVQTVRKDSQRFFWNLLEAFRKKTGVPMLLNTPLSLEEPLPCTSADALRCFMEADFDFLVVGDTVFSKKEQSFSLTA